MNKELRSLIELSDNKTINLFYSGNTKSEENYANFCNFYYYTKIVEDDAILLTNNNENKAHLFIPETNEMYTKWIGKRISKVEASQKSGIPIEQIHYISEFTAFLNSLLNSFEFETVCFDYETVISENIRKQINEIKEKHPHILINSNHILNTKLRLIKSKEQIEDLKLAIQITCEGIKSLMLNSKVGGYEYQLQSHFEQVLKYHNTKNSFETILASGVNACCLHYSTNDSLMDQKDLVLADLGARYNYMSADISRTFPINGKFSKKQALVYDAVLRTNKEVINFIKPGVKMLELNDLAKNLLAKELIELKLIKDESEVSKYYYHSIGHQLGMLTHDLTLKNIVLEENMVITVEPGLYIEEWGIGVRIEDDILVTKDGHINLSVDIIKEREDIEEFMK